MTPFPASTQQRGLHTTKAMSAALSRAWAVVRATNPGWHRPAHNCVVVTPISASQGPIRAVLARGSARGNGNGAVRTAESRAAHAAPCRMDRTSTKVFAQVQVRSLTGGGGQHDEGLEAEIAVQGERVRAMKAAVEADAGAYSKDVLKAEIAKLQVLKANRAGNPSDSAPPITVTAADSAKLSVEEVSGPNDESYRRQRWADLEAFEARDGVVFPHKFDPTLSIPAFLDRYAGLAAGEQTNADGLVRIAGRIHSVRRSGKGLVFFDLKGDGARMQLMCDKKHFEGEWEQLDTLIKRGDIVGASGTPARNQRGELCVIPSHVELLAPCVRLLPKEHFGLKDPDARFRNRHVDLLANARVRQIFEGRSAVVRAIREYLDARSFLEVETPVLAAKASGAAARPFSTHHNSLDAKLHMRVAPELYLKRLVVGGLDRVYELGKCFRNEGVDATHNPEFTSVEVYQAYADYKDMMLLTQDLLAHVAHRVLGSTSVHIKGSGTGGRGSTSARDSSGSAHARGVEGVTLDFGVAFEQLDYMEALANAAGVALPLWPAPSDLESPHALAFLREVRVGAVCGSG